MTAAADFGSWAAIPYGKPHPEWTRVGRARLARDPTPAGADVNAWVNRRIRYLREVGDHWQSPAETLALQTGDCEDLAILKRAILIARGCPVEAAFIVVGPDAALRQVHAVLLARGRVYDCTTDRVLTPADLPDFQPALGYGHATTFFYGRRAV